MPGNRNMNTGERWAPHRWISVLASAPPVMPTCIETDDNRTCFMQKLNRVIILTRCKCNYLYHWYFSGLFPDKFKLFEVLLWMYLINMEFFKKNCRQKHEKLRICFIFEIIDQQPRRNPTTPDLRGKAHHWQPWLALRWQSDALNDANPN